METAIEFQRWLYSGALDTLTGPALALAAGLVPCPLTTFIMTYAVANGVVAGGLALSGAFALGMMTTVAAFPLIAIALRTRVVPFMAGSESWRARIGKFLEVGAAVAIILLGAIPLLKDGVRL